MIKRVLTIAGSDTWGGGGLQTDLKTFENFKVFGLSVITCVAVEEDTKGFVIRALPAELIAAQLATIENSFALDGIKIGLLANSEIVAVVADFCKRQAQKGVPIVLDPVLAFKETSAKAQHTYIEQIRALGKFATLVTPNLQEAELLSGVAQVRTIATMKQAATQLYEQSKTPVVIKGGVGVRGDEAVDVFFDGAEFYQFAKPKTSKVTTNGAGCCFSASLCAKLAQGQAILPALQASKQFVFEAIEEGLLVTTNSGNVWHGAQGGNVDET